MIVELSVRKTFLAITQVALAAIAIGLYYAAVMTHPFPEWLPVRFAFSAVAAGALVVAVVLSLFCNWPWVSLGALFGLLFAATRLQFRAVATSAGVFQAATSALAEWHRLLAAILASVTVASWVTVRLRLGRPRKVSW